MKRLQLLLLFLPLNWCNVAAQEITPNQMVRDNYYMKGNFFIYWGWNRSNYSRSDIRFHGKNYDFTIHDVVARDRQSPFSANLYFNPATITIPQYDFRIGYFINDHYQISIGADHMKYVMQNYLNNTYQTVLIDGYINDTGTRFDGVYEQDTIALTEDFLLFEHTDGLNYENIECRRFDVLFGRKYFSIALNEGLGMGILLPKTNTTLLNNERYDEFHVAGYGASLVAALNLTFFNYFFIQSEWKGGFIHMPDIRTTKNKSDKAEQSFWFSQYNVVFGVNFRLTKPKKTEI
jgi:hypothetical protein